VRLRPEPVEADVDVHVAQLAQVRDLLGRDLGGVGAYAQRQPDICDRLADRQKVRVHKWLTAGERDPLHPGRQQARQDPFDDVGQPHVLAPVAGADETVGAVQIAPLGDLHQRLPAAVCHRSPEEAGVRVRVDQQRALHDVPPERSALRPSPKTSPRYGRGIAALTEDGKQLAGDDATRRAAQSCFQPQIALKTSASS